MKSLLVSLVLLTSVNSMAYDLCLPMAEETCEILNGHYEPEYETCCIAKSSKSIKKSVEAEYCEVSVDPHKCVLNGGHQIDLLCCYGI